MAPFDSPVATLLQELLHQENAAESFNQEMRPRPLSRIVKILIGLFAKQNLNLFTTFRSVSDCPSVGQFVGRSIDL